MKALITGAAGFAGGHLLEAIAAKYGGPIDGTYRPALETFPAGANKLVRKHALDILDREQCRSILRHVNPTHIFHLAGPAQVGDSFKHADEVNRTIV